MSAMSPKSLEVAVERPNEKSDRILELMRHLDTDATELRQETESLRAERARWAPFSRPFVCNANGGNTSPLSAAAVLASTPRLPQKCSRSIADAAAQERKAGEAQRRTQQAEREKQRHIERRAEVECFTDEAVRKADQRRRRAEEQLAELKATRQRETDANQARADDADIKCNEGLKRLEASIESERLQADADIRNLRRQVAEERSRGDDAIVALRADHTQHCADFERDLDEFDAASAAAVAAAVKRCRDAEEASIGAWNVCKEKALALHNGADIEAEQVELSRQDQTMAINKVLDEMHTSFEEELHAINSHEKELRNDRSMEDKAVAFEAAMQEAIRCRKCALDVAMHQSCEEIANILAAATDAGTSLMSRIAEAELTADREINGILLEVERFAQGSHEMRVADLRARLNDTVATVKVGIADRVRQFGKDVERLTLDADEELTATKQKVNYFRQENLLKARENYADVGHRLKETMRSNAEIVADMNEKVRQTQEQMVKYVASMHEDMVAVLQAPSLPEVTLRLPLGGSTPVLSLPATSPSASESVAA
mmetsp:Transcript_107560/g.302800  ORF Transcript_107560/g.302800 Transcript_107560/m.302800 type:complete len:548 (+) Transcript_107560:64-1707(+)